MGSPRFPRAPGEHWGASGTLGEPWARDFPSALSFTQEDRRGHGPWRSSSFLPGAFQARCFSPFSCFLAHFWRFSGSVALVLGPLDSNLTVVAVVAIVVVVLVALGVVIVVELLIFVGMEVVNVFLPAVVV